jgi:hypothetical protein
LNTIGKDAPTIKDAASSKSVQYHSGINLEDNILADMMKWWFDYYPLKCVLPITI